MSDRRIARRRTHAAERCAGQEISGRCGARPKGISLFPSPGMAGPQVRRSQTPLVLADQEQYEGVTCRCHYPQQVQSFVPKDRRARRPSGYTFCGLRCSTCLYHRYVLCADVGDRPRRPPTRRRSERTPTGRRPMRAMPRHLPDAAPPSDRQPATRRRRTTDHPTRVLPATAPRPDTPTTWHIGCSASSCAQRTGRAIPHARHTTCSVHVGSRRRRGAKEQVT